MVFIVDQNDDSANDGGPGTAERPFRTIGAAALVARAGDTVRVMPGVYRERVAPRYSGETGAPITYESAVPRKAVIKASERWQPDWEPVPSCPPLVRGAFSPELFELDQRQAADWPAFPRSFNPYTIPLRAAGSYDDAEASDVFGAVASTDAARRPTHRLTIGQLFVEGAPLRQVASRAECAAVPATWTVCEDQSGLYVHVPEGLGEPASLNVELTTRSRCFAPYRRGAVHHIHVRGFVMEHGASDFHAGFYAGKSPQLGVLGTRGGRHWVIENNVVRFGKTLGIDVGTEGRVDADGLDQGEPEAAGDAIIRGNIVSDNGAGGIQGIRSRRTRIVNNEIVRNNRLGFTAAEVGGIKLHFFEGGLIEGNAVNNNECYGIWLDNMWHNARVTRNTVLSNHGAGMFIEMGFGPLLIDNNVIGLTRGSSMVSGDGIYSHDSSGVTFCHNLVIHNANFGIWMHAATERNAGVYQDGVLVEKRRVECSHWTVINNIVVGNHAGAVSAPVEHERSTGNRFDHNVYAGAYDRWNVETYSAPLDQPLFTVNTNKHKSDKREVVDALLARLEEAGVPTEERPGRSRLLSLPLLTLREWQLLTGWDASSRWGRVLRPMVCSTTPFVAFTIDGSPKRVAAAPPVGVRRDYSGETIADRPVAGPFQRLRMHPALDAEVSQSTDPRGPFGDVGGEHRNHVFLGGTNSK